MAEVSTPHIGKNVIETLTLGMYENPLFIYREYIQNAADQIDIAVEQSILTNRNEGLIDITINPNKKTITILDNATGINKDKVWKFLGDVANSEKDLSKRKGFRGIGRLGGLGYCNRLVFETSFKGENTKSIITLNAEFLRAILANIQDNRDAASVISAITTVLQVEEKKDSHYFKVILENVSDELLKINEVITYLSVVAPIPFSSKFSFSERITSYFKSRSITFDEYVVKVNTEQIFKAYKDALIFTQGDKKDGRITTVGFFDVFNKNSVLLAVGWYGISDKVNYVIEEKKNPERGIRIRKSNIAIGDEATLFPRFKSERTNLRYIGEIHVLSNGFIPNARRDYFNLTPTVEEFEASLKVIFDDFESNLPHVASNLHNRLKSVQSARELIVKYKHDINKFNTTEEREQRFQEVIDGVKTARDAAKKIEKIKADGVNKPTINELFEGIIDDYNYEISNKELYGIYKEDVIPPLKFTKVTASQEKILNEVVIFLQQELNHRSAAPLIVKLQKKYN